MSLMSTFLLNVLSYRNFGDAIAVQDLRKSSTSMKFCQMSALEPPNFGAAPEYILEYKLVTSHD